MDADTQAAVDLLIQQMIMVRNAADTRSYFNPYRPAMHAITWMEHAHGHLIGRPHWPRLWLRDAARTPSA